MNIYWAITNDDISKIQVFVKEHHNYFVEQRIERNINRKNIKIDKDTILKMMIMCLLTTQQRSGPNSVIGVFLRKKDFPFTELKIKQNIGNVEGFVRETLQENGLNRYINRVSKFFTTNIDILERDWLIIEGDLKMLKKNSLKKIEREVADKLNDTFEGFGPKQSRNFLQALGLTQYEIPIDSRIVDWFRNEFNFPVPLSSVALQSKGYYHFVLEGIQYLCDKAGIFPCVLDAAIFSSFDKGEWSDEGEIF